MSFLFTKTNKFKKRKIKTIVIPLISFDRSFKAKVNFYHFMFSSNNSYLIMIIYL